MPTPENRRIGVIHAVVKARLSLLDLCYRLFPDPKIWWTVAVGVPSVFSILYGRILKSNNDRAYPGRQGKASDSADIDGTLPREPI
jgi:hypothetical protein